MQIIKKFYETGNIKYIAKLDNGENIVALRWWSGVGDELNENKDHYEYKNGNIQLKAITGNGTLNPNSFPVGFVGINPSSPNINVQVSQIVTEALQNTMRESLQGFIGQPLNNNIERQIRESQGNLLTRFTNEINNTTDNIQSTITRQQDYIDAHNARLYNLENKVFKRDKNRFLFSWLTGEFGFGFIITRQIMQPKTLTDVCGNYCLLKINLKNLFTKKWKETIYIKNIYEFRYDVQEINPSIKELEEFKDLLKKAEHNPS